jgi:hypothetical protein
MRTTPPRRASKEKRQQAAELKKEIRTIEKLATIPPKAREAMIETREEDAKKLEREAADLRELARVEDLTVWVMEKAKAGKVYKYWMASWREGGRVRNVHLGSCKKVSHEEALQKARKMKAGSVRITLNSIQR